MKKEKHDFEPVHIRSKKIAGGRQSLFLDIAKDGVRRREFLKLYLIPEESKGAKSTNRSVMRMAEEIKAKRTLEVMRNGLQLPDHGKANVPLVDWLEEQNVYYRGHGNMNYARTIHNLIRHLGNHAKKGLRIKDVTPNFLRGFLEYLRGDGVNKYGGHLCQETIYTYFTVFSILMNKAVLLDLIPVNPFHKLSQAEKPQRRTKKREFLTMEELRKLAATECDDWRVKKAFMFCCFTGLRYIDVSRLKWKHIENLGDGTFQVVITQKKTQEPVYVPLSANAMKWLPEKGDNGRENYVFQFRDRSIIYKYLQDWGKRAGIEKHLIFHMSRHTCATMLLYYGADLYTVSKILGHQSIKSTQIYAKVVDGMKRKAVDNVPKIEG
ncbi:MAG: site-specific integrase [Bacteroidales bacterium]|nr:site-specific integrase [Bacteroidales bacterium]